MVLFTTGLGTPTGNPIVPVIKVSSNTRTSEKMSDIIDVNTGEVIEGKKTIEEMGEHLLDVLTTGLTSVVNTFAPELVILSGTLEKFDMFANVKPFVVPGAYRFSTAMVNLGIMYYAIKDRL